MHGHGGNERGKSRMFGDGLPPKIALSRRADAPVDEAGVRPVNQAITIEDLATELGAITSRSDARAILNRASRVAGVSSHRPLDLRELLMVCQALAAEGGLVHELAERIASRTLGDEEPTDAELAG
jgi:hypothetical protein